MAVQEGFCERLVPVFQGLVKCGWVSGVVSNQRGCWLPVVTIAPMLLWASCGRPGSTLDQSSAAAQPVAVKVRTPKAFTRAGEVEASGSVEAWETAKAAFQVSARVVRVSVQEGDYVRRGQTLAELDQADYRHALEAAVAQESAARANQTKAETGARAQEVEQARIALERAEDEYRRMRTLFERKSLAPNDFKKFEAAYLVAQQRYSEAREGTRREDKEAAAAALEQAAAQVREAQKRVADTALRAPISGVIARRMIDPGDSIAAGYPAFVVMNLDPAQVRVGVPEAEIGSVRKGQTGRILIPSIPGQTFEGRVTEVGVAADSASRTYTVKIEVPNPKTVLRAGMVAEAHIRIDTVVRALTLPGECIVADAQGATLVYVYFPAQKRAYARRVETGSAYGREVEIKAGLSGNELVIVAGQNRLQEGSVVEVVP